MSGGLLGTVRLIQVYVKSLIRKWAELDAPKMDFVVPVDDAIDRHLQRAMAALTEAEYWTIRRPGMLKRGLEYIENELRIQAVHLELTREEAALVACSLELVTEAGLDDHYTPEDHDKMVDVAQRIRRMDLVPHTPTKADG